MLTTSTDTIEQKKPITDNIIVPDRAEKPDRKTGCGLNSVSVAALASGNAAVRRTFRRPVTAVFHLAALRNWKNASEPNQAENHCRLAERSGGDK
jgi:hypothetical protein